MKTSFLLLIIFAWTEVDGREPQETCVLVKDCPSALEQIRQKGNLEELTRKICGYDGRYEKIWCSVPCETPDLQRGKCVPAKDCEPYKALIAKSDTNNPNTITYLREFHCESTPADEVIHVCCSEELAAIPDDTLIESRNPYLTEPYKTSEERPAPFWDANEQCGMQMDEFKVVGGTLADLGQFPWLALLEYRYKGKRQLNCGATLINRRYVLTAAHCVDDSYPVNVILGEHNTTSSPDCFHTHCAPSPLVIKVERVIPHPKWIDADRRFYDDIALLRLAEDVKFSNFIQPICLPRKDYNAKLQERFTVAGWGRTEHGSSSDVKRHASILLQDRKVCNNTISIPLEEGQLCVGGGSIDSCKGDSGGPLMKSLLVNGRYVWYIVGVVSLGFNEPCGTKERPGIYTYVPNYVDWIRNNVRL